MSPRVPVTLVRWAPVAAAALAFVAFVPVLSAEWVNWDDEVSFLRNSRYRGLGVAQLRWMFTTTLLGHWSPLTWVTWGADYLVSGMNPSSYHFTSVLIHAVNVALLVLVARRLLAKAFAMERDEPAVVAGALFAALAFGIHPLRVEPVAWISGRRDVLCATFYLAAALAYLRGVASGGAIAPKWWALSVGAFAAALTSKASAMTLPLTLLLIDIYPLRRQSLGWGRLIVEKAPYAVLALGAAAMAIVAREDGGNITMYARYGPDARVALTAYALVFYPWKSLWPTGLSTGYELPARISLAEPRFIVAVALVVLVTGALIVVRRRLPGLLTAWVAAAIVLLPVSGLVLSGEQIAADRYSYLSSFGYVILAGAALTWMIRRGAAPVLAGVGAVGIIGVLGVATWIQTTTWHDAESLWRRAVDVDPTCSLCESNLGRVIARPGRFDEAEAHVARAIALRPDRPGPHENMAVIMLGQGRLQQATTYFRRVVAIRPLHAPSRNNLGLALAESGRFDEAEAEFREAARLSPTLVDAHSNLGVLYMRQGRLDDAIELLQRALALDPSRTLVARNLEQARAARDRK